MSFVAKLGWPLNSAWETLTWSGSKIFVFVFRLASTHPKLIAIARQVIGIGNAGVHVLGRDRISWQIERHAHVRWSVSKCLAKQTTGPTGRV